MNQTERESQQVGAERIDENILYVVKLRVRHLLEKAVKCNMSGNKLLLQTLYVDHNHSHMCRHYNYLHLNHMSIAVGSVQQGLEVVSQLSCCCIESMYAHLYVCMHV